MRGNQEVASYYDQKLAGIAEATGAGMIWFMGRDHLSPPLSNIDYYAQNASRWREACSLRIIDLAERMGISRCSWVLDLRCGIGGPGRDVAQATGAMVCGISISISQLLNLRRLSADVSSSYTNSVKADMQQLPVASGSVDGVFSVNAIYHVNNPKEVIAEACRVLRRRGRFGVDDWFTTSQTTSDELEKLRYNWSTGSGGFHNVTSFCLAMQRSGFRLLEVVDYTSEAGAFLSEGRFGATYDVQVAPVLRRVFPLLYKYDGYEPAHADMAVAQLRADILYMGALYRSGGAVYRQIVGEKY